MGVHAGGRLGVGGERGLSSMKVVLVMFKDNERRDFPLEQEETVIGRRQDAHLRIPTADVSRQHCAVIRSGKSIVAKDLGSSNGTFVNGKRIAEAELGAGDQLRVGPVTFIVQVNGQPEDISPKDIKARKKDDSFAAMDDDDTFELSEEDFDLDDALSALSDGDEDEDDMP